MFGARHFAKELTTYLHGHTNKQQASANEKHVKLFRDGVASGPSQGQQELPSVSHDFENICFKTKLINKI